MTGISRYIYQYMCDEIVGSKNVVKYRRRFLRVFEFVHNNCLSPSKGLVVSGSKAEGLDLSGSDLDIMLISNKYRIYESKSKSKKESELSSNTVNRHILKIETDNAQPGFVLLRVQKEPNCDQTIFERNEDGTYLSSKRYLSNLGSKYTDSKINGPCLSSFDGDLDVAHSLKCSEWPSVAKDWTTRNRSSGWPSVFLVSKIVQYGVLLVPIGSKSRSECVHPLEWRLSFSVSEKLLIHTWTHTQLLCYAILKILLKEVVKTTHSKDSVLCSYFLKTTLFWLSDEVDTRKWTPNSLLDCFVMCLDRLTYWITHKYIPNYFIPEHNMIDRLYDQLSWDELLALMSFLHGIGWQSILLCDSFQLFKMYRHLENPTLNGLWDFEKAIIPLMHIINHRYLDVTYGTINESFAKCVRFIVKATLPKKYKIIFLIVLSSMSLNITDSLLCQHQRNKLYYSKYKQVMSRYFISAQFCVVTGWALLALNFYLCGQYHRVSRILEFAIAVCSSEQFLIYEKDIHVRDIQDQDRYLSTCNLFSCLKPIKYHTRYRYIHIKNFQTFDYLLQPPPQLNMLLFETSFFLYYLRFACYHRLQNVDRIQHCLQDLESLCKHAKDTRGIYEKKIQDSMIRFAYQITFNKHMESWCNMMHNAQKRSSRC